MNIGVLCAMQKEYDLFVDCLHDKKAVSADMLSGMTKDGNHRLLVARCGIGKVNAALSARMLIDEGVDRIFSIGVAGALDESLEVGDVVVGSEYCYHDVWCGEPNKPGQIQGLPQKYLCKYELFLPRIGERAQIGGIATGDWFVQTKGEARRIREYLGEGFIAVDMESAAIAQVCHKCNIPFTSVRVISDNPLKENQQEQYEGFWNDMAARSFFALMKGIL